MSGIEILFFIRHLPKLKLREPKLRDRNDPLLLATLDLLENPDLVLVPLLVDPKEDDFPVVDRLLPNPPDLIFLLREV